MVSGMGGATLRMAYDSTMNEPGQVRRARLVACGSLRCGLLCGLLCALLSAGCGSESSPQSSSETSPETSPAGQPAPGAAADQSDWRALYDAWTYPQPIPDFALTDHRGQRLQLGTLASGHVLIGFIYTRCPLPEACPMTTEKMRRVQTRWRDLNRRGQTAGQTLQLLSLTLDPGYDTPARLAAFARDRDLDTSDWHLATGPEELMQSALPSLFSVLALPRAPGDIQHTVKVALLAPGLRIAKEWPDNAFSVDDVLAEILPRPAPATIE